MPNIGYRGRNITIYPLARIVESAAMTIGSDVIIDDFVFIGRHEELVIGNHVHIASHASITGGGRCFLADFCGVSSGARLLTGSDDFGGSALTGPTVPAEFRQVTRGEVVVGAHAIIGANAVVLPNVRIGEGAAIGAGSVVTRDVEPWMICAGAPARPLRPRPSAALLQAEQRLYEEYGAPERSFRPQA
jgi:acetyltransferase-like isoleucine patch superfamily enzyme